MFKKVVLFTFAISCALATSAHATPIFVPPSLNAGDPYHLVFVSSTSSTTNYGGISGADALVQGLADAAGIGVTKGVTWQAILSDSATDAISRFNPGVPIFDTQGNRVAVSGAALWNTASVPLENPIGFDENGLGGIAIPREVWTGTNPSGTFDQAFSNWTNASSSNSATAGSSFLTGTGWIGGGGYPTEIVPLSLFASSSLLVATTTTSSVPEPSTLVPAAIGLFALGFYGWRRRKRVA